MMKTNPLGTMLTLALVVLALVTSALLLRYVQMARKLQPLQAEVLVANRNQALVQGLLGEAVEYAGHDSSIEPVLQSMGVRVRAGTASPPTKPVSK